MRCFLDLDGVLVNFVGGALRLLGRTLDPYPAGEWDFHRHLGLTDDDFWGQITRGGAHFWADLEWLPDGREVHEAVDAAFGPEGVYLLSSPSQDPQSLAGKAMWVQRHLPQYRRRLLLGVCKEAVAHPGVLLVDDSDANVAAFRCAGGAAILVPRPWNHLHPYAAHAASSVRRALEEAKYGR